ncbi:MAG: coproporphyrinogen III oxidase, partial [Anaerotignum sp.]|nr:coproporphyrinogen III oxidase [Anaerotignum sp.]
MGIVTDLTRMWLTRSAKPFTFTNEYDSFLPYGDCKGLGLYVHIPFCRKICDFCPYCKEVYDTEKYDRYIDALLAEIRMVGSQYKEKKQVTSLYFGGGTPALAADRLQEIIGTIQKYFMITE